jgi:hypothetical protein
MVRETQGALLLPKHTSAARTHTRGGECSMYGDTNVHWPGNARCPIESTLHVPECVPCNASSKVRLSCNALVRTNKQTNVHMLSARNAASSAPGGRSSGSTTMGMVNVRSASHRPMKHKAFRSCPKFHSRMSLTSVELRTTGHAMHAAMGSVVPWCNEAPLWPSSTL